MKNNAGVKLTEGVDYTVTVPAGRVHAGSYRYTVKGTGNYKGSAAATFTIQPQPLPAARCTLYSETVTYNGKVRTPAVTVKNNAGKTLTEGTDYTVEIPEGRTDAGEYPYEIRGTGDYAGTVQKTFTILPQPLAAERCTLYSETVTYNGNVRTPAVTVKNAQGETLTRGRDYKVTVPEGRTDAGVYPYTIVGAGNYAGTVEKTFTILPQKLSAENVSLYSETVTYNGKVRTPKVTVTNAAGETLAEGVDYTVTVPEGRTAPGVYTYTVTGAGRYTGSVKATFTIKARS